MVELTRYDKPVAVIMSYEDYEEKRKNLPSLLDKLSVLKKQFADVVDDEGFNITPSRECPDYSKDPWT